MKKRLSILVLFLGIYSFYAQENVTPAYVGDNFSLEGALAALKDASTIEEFEKLINQEKSDVNNLDLNNDGKTDYIQVEELVENNIHILVLSTFLDENEKQDIATIAIEKIGEEEAYLQIEGDSDLFPENTLIEPFDSEEVIKSNSKGPSPFDIEWKPIVVNVWTWPVIRFIYAPNYVVWFSPYRWRHYPLWWKPWVPIRYSVFYSRNARHRVYFRTTTIRRSTIARKIYLPRRRTSTIIVRNNRNTTIVKKNKRGSTVIRKKSRR